MAPLNHSYNHQIFHAIDKSFHHINSSPTLYSIFNFKMLYFLRSRFSVKERHLAGVIPQEWYLIIFGSARSHESFQHPKSFIFGVSSPLYSLNL